MKSRYCRSNKWGGDMKIEDELEYKWLIACKDDCAFISALKSLGVDRKCPFVKLLETVFEKRLADEVREEQLKEFPDER